VLSSFQAILGIDCCVEDLLCLPRQRFLFELETAGTKRGRRIYLFLQEIREFPFPFSLRKQWKWESASPAGETQRASDKPPSDE